jgi:hypothetical protein
MLHTQLSTGFVIGTSVTLFLLLACTGLGIGSAYYMRGEGGWKWFTGFLALGTIIFLAAAAIDFPWSAQYHEYVPESGRVQAISSRFIAQDGGGSDQRFAVILHGQTYACDDSRCSNLHKGSPVTLMCIREYQFNGTPGYVCNWGKAALNG